MTRLRAGLTISRLSEHTVLISGEFERVLVEDAVMSDILETSMVGAVDPEFLEELSVAHGRKNVESAVHTLLRKRVLVRGSEPPGSSAAFWEGFGFDSEPCSLLGDVELVMLDQTLDARQTVESFHRFGLNVSCNGRFLVAVVSDYMDVQLASINRQRLSLRAPWIVLKPIGRRIWVGPVFVPGVTACWQCLFRSVATKRWIDFVLNRKMFTTAAGGHVRSTVDAALSLAATEVVKWQRFRESALCDTIWTLDFLDMGVEKHATARSKDCTACTGLGRPRMIWSSDSIRSRDFLTRLRAQLSSITGIARNMTNHRVQLAPSVHLASVEFHPAPNFVDGFLSLVPQTAAGRGMSAVDAETAALAEAVERHSLYFQGTENILNATQNELSDLAVDPRILASFSDEQLQQATSLDSMAEEYARSMHHYTTHDRIEWVSVRDLATGDQRFVPAAYCYFRFRASPAFVIDADSNGCAAGESVEAAQVRGILELIERDAISIWWYNRLHRRELGFETLESEVPTKIRRELQESGYDCHLLDLSTDWNVSVCAAISYDQNGADVAIGFAAGLDRATAAVAAMTEMLQVRLASQSVATVPEIVRLRNWQASTNVRENSWLRPVGKSSARDHAPAPAEWPERMQLLLATAKKLGLSVLGLDLTRSSIGIPVYRIVIPGMRHIRPRFGPGRLFELPVRLGWVANATHEKQMNPVPIPI